MSNPSLPGPLWTTFASPAAAPLHTQTRLGHFLTRFSDMLSTRRQRRALAELDDRTLHDIGVTRADVQREANRRFWDVDL